METGQHCTLVPRHNLPMTAKPVSAARRHLGELIELARGGEEVVIVKDSRPAVALIPIDDSDLELATRITDRQAERLWEMAAAGPAISFGSAEAAIRHLKGRASKKR